jgi:hypothetical protein
MGVELCCRNGDYIYASWRNVVLIVLRGEHADADLRAVETCMVRISESHPEGVVLFTSIEENSKPPTDAMRAEITRIQGDPRIKMVCEAIVLHGRGFFASTLMMMISAAWRIVGRKVPRDVTYGIDQAAQFVQRHMAHSGQTVTVQEVAQAMKEAGEF